MAKRITKADLQARAGQVEDVEIPELGDDFVIPLRRLNSVEGGKIETIQGRSIQMNGEPEFDEAGNPKLGSGMDFSFDFGKMAEDDREAKHAAFAFAFEPEDGEKLTPEEVGQLDGDVVKAVAAKVFEMSGIRADLEQLKRVQQDSGGAEPNAPELAGVSAGA